MVLIIDIDRTKVNTPSGQALNTLKKRRCDIWDTRRHWQLVEETQAMVDGGDDIKTTNANSDWECSRNMEIWVDEHSMIVLNGKQLANECNEKEQSKVERILHYY
jgi:hypothetical protein